MKPSALHLGVDFPSGFILPALALHYSLFSMLMMYSTSKWVHSSVRASCKLRSPEDSKKRDFPIRKLMPAEELFAVKCSSCSKKLDL